MIIKYKEIKEVEFKISNDGLRKMREDIGYHENDPVSNKGLIEDWIGDCGVDDFIHEYRKYITNLHTNYNDYFNIKEEHE